MKCKTQRPNRSNGLLVVYFVLAACMTSRADLIKDKLDQAKSDYLSSTEAAKHGLIAAFDEQIKAISETGNLDAVEELRTQREAFVSSQAVPEGSAMRAAVSKYEGVISAAEVDLKAAFESALVEYTKAGNFDDAEAIKRNISERFGPATGENANGAPSARPTTSASSGDPILDALVLAKQEFLATVGAAHADVLAAIEAQAKEAAAKGDLDEYKSYADLAERVKAEILVPEEIKDTAIRGANAKFVSISEAAAVKLRSAYQTAISEYTKAQRFEEAETIKAELQDGGWFAGLTAHPATLDLLKTLDLSQDTIRKGWRLNKGVLEPTSWDNEHGPALRIPVSAKGSYTLDLRFALGEGAPGLGSLYFQLPVGRRCALIELTSTWQALYIGSREVRRDLHLPPGTAHGGSVNVDLLGDEKCRISFSLDGKQCLSWEGASDEVTMDFGPDFASLQENSNFGIDTKTGRVFQARLSGSSDVIEVKRMP